VSAWRRRIWRFARWPVFVVGGVLLLVLLVVLVGGFVLLRTESGARWALERGAGYVPGEVEVGEVRGTLQGPLELRDVRYANEGLETTIDRLEIDWNLSSLTRRQADVERLRARGITVKLPPPDEEPAPRDEPFELPEVDLPLDVLVRDAVIEDITIERHDAEPIVIDRVALDLDAGPGRGYRVAPLVVESDLFDLRAEGRLTATGDYPLELDARWSLRLPDQPEISGEGTVGGSLADLTLDQRITAPEPVRVTGSIDQPLDDFKLDLAARFDDLELPEFGIGWPAAPLAGQVALEGPLDELDLSGTIAGEILEPARAEVDFDAVYRGEQLALDEVVVNLPDTGGRIVAGGEVALGGEAPRFDIEARWQDLGWPLVGEPAVRSPQGRLTVAGTADDYALTARGRLESEEAPAGELRIEGRGSTERLEIAELLAETLGGRIEGSGTVAWSPVVRWQAQLAAADVNPEALAPEFAGQLSFDLETEGRLTEQGEPQGSLLVESLDGRLRGQPVTGSADLDFRGPQADVSTARLTWGSLETSLTGTIGERWDARYDLDAPELSLVLPDLRGVLEASGTLAGELLAPRVTAEFSARGIGYGTYAAETVTGEANVGLDAEAPLELSLSARGVDALDQVLERVELAIEGTRAAHTAALTVAADPQRLALEVQGALDETWGWSGTIERLRLEAPETGTWALAAAPVPLTASAEQVELGRLCWESDRGGLCLEGSWQAGSGRWSVGANLADIPLGLADLALPPDMEISGPLGGTITARGVGDRIEQADVDLAPGPGQIGYLSTTGEPVELAFEPGTLELTVTPDGASGTARVDFAEAGYVAASARLPRYGESDAPLVEQPIDGTIDLVLDQTDFISGFVEGITDVEGEARAQITLGGTLSAPTVSGTAAVADAGWGVPPLGIRVEDVDLTAESTDERALAVQGTAKSGPGTISLDGTVGLSPEAERPINLFISGQDFEAYDTGDIRVLASPDVEVFIEDNVLMIDGVVEVPEASFEIDRGEVEGGPVPVSDDVVFVGREPGEEDEQLVMAAILRIELGEEVRIDVYGLEARVEGSILVRELPGEVTTATGTLRLVDGTFQAYGQDLEIQRGRLLFAGGPIDNPSLDVRASRTARDGTVAGIELTGTVQSPEIEVWSDPAMTQSEALAYLLLGRPLEGGATESDGDLLTKAGESLGLKGGELLAEAIGQRFGLEEARIQRGETFEEASLVLGKYLSPRLYVSYGIGLFEAADTVRVRYILGSKWTLQAESGENTGADLLYTIERGD
jgi:translocation and assembly module TamB